MKKFFKVQFIDTTSDEDELEIKKSQLLMNTLNSPFSAKADGEIKNVITEM